MPPFFKDAPRKSWTNYVLRRWGGTKGYMFYRCSWKSRFVNVSLWYSWCSSALTLDGASTVGALFKAITIKRKIHSSSSNSSHPGQSKHSLLCPWPLSCPHLFFVCPRVSWMVYSSSHWALTPLNRKSRDPVPCYRAWASYITSSLDCHAQ